MMMTNNNNTNRNNTNHTSNRRPLPPGPAAPCPPAGARRVYYRREPKGGLTKGGFSSFICFSSDRC